MITKLITEVLKDKSLRGIILRMRRTIMKIDQVNIAYIEGDQNKC